MYHSLFNPNIFFKINSIFKLHLQSHLHRVAKMISPNELPKHEGEISQTVIQQEIRTSADIHSATRESLFTWNYPQMNTFKHNCTKEKISQSLVTQKPRILKTEEMHAVSD